MFKKWQEKFENWEKQFNKACTESKAKNEMRFWGRFKNRRKLALRHLFEGLSKECYEQSGGGNLSFFLEEIYEALPGWVDEETFKRQVDNLDFEKLKK